MADLLLDTHVWLWWNAAPERLSLAAKARIADPRVRVFLSAASVWELAIKAGLGKLTLGEPVAAYVTRRLASDAVESLPVTAAHAAGVEGLARLHKDPFDRILVAQARAEGLILLTVDPHVLAYGAGCEDARASA